jgi:Fuc2NAc and GlcNAc transferase
MSAALLVLGGGALVAWALTGWVRAYAVRRALLDVPNHRSLHARPTPRGGGAALAAVVLGGTLAAALAGAVPPRLGAVVVVGGGAIAWIGWLDDRRHVRARWRASLHLAAALFAVVCLGGLPSLRVGDWTVPLGWFGMMAAVLGTMWLINLYNFMDGIDALAGGEAVAVGVAGGTLALLSGNGGIALVAFLTAGASLGFLLWNWPPARIFMGDVGSGLLGYLFAVLAIASEREGALPLLVWLLLLGVFVFDATVTLLRRMARRDKWYLAHRTHAYQRLVQAGFSHGRVAGVVAAVNGVLAAGAALAWRDPTLLPAVVAAGLGLLTALYLWVERLGPMPPSAAPVGGRSGGPGPVTLAPPPPPPAAPVGPIVPAAPAPAGHRRAARERLG